MKASKLLTGLHDPLAQDLILYNALCEIDRLEEKQRALHQQITYYESLFQQLKEHAAVHYGDTTKSFFIMFDGIYERDEETLFADLRELLQLEKPEEGKEEE